VGTVPLMAEDVGDSFQLGRLSVSVIKSSVKSTGVQNPESTRPLVLSEVQSRGWSPPVEHPESRDRPTVDSNDDVEPPMLALLRDDTMALPMDGPNEAVRPILLDWSWAC